MAHCISVVRRSAEVYSLGSPDRRDYLAVLYLTVLHALRYAGTAPELAENFRLLVGLAWVLEDALSRIIEPGCNKSPNRLYFDNGLYNRFNLTPINTFAKMKEAG